MSKSYEAQRLQNIKDNEALLHSLGLGVPTSKPSIKKSSATKSKASKPKPCESLPERKPRPDQEDDGEAGPSKRRKGEDGTPVQSDTSLRRSGRRSLPAVNYSDRNRAARVKRERETSPGGGVDGQGGQDGEDGHGGQDELDMQEGQDARQRKAQKLGTRTQDPKQFGHIPGVEVGKWWASRMDASTDAVHAPTVAGISGNAEEGAWSVALSGGYADDVDLGEAFTYTGSGGRDLTGTKQAPKNLRTAPQTSDQSFDNPKNASLKRSAETRKPVRVIRGFKLDSPYAPPQGYRYDGLYVVEKAWMADGLAKGLLVCRYAFKRLPNQPPLEVTANVKSEVKTERED